MLPNSRSKTPTNTPFEVRSSMKAMNRPSHPMAITTARRSSASAVSSNANASRRDKPANAGARIPVRRELASKASPLQRTASEAKTASETLSPAITPNNNPVLRHVPGTLTVTPASSPTKSVRTHNRLAASKLRRKGRPAPAISRRPIKVLPILNPTCSRPTNGSNRRPASSGRTTG